jgi:hypothetical protein
MMYVKIVTVPYGIPAMIWFYDIREFRKFGAVSGKYHLFHFLTTAELIIDLSHVDNSISLLTCAANVIITG